MFDLQIPIVCFCLGLFYLVPALWILYFIKKAPETWEDERLARRVVYLDGRVRAWGAPAEVLDREWDRAAFSGHDHEAPSSRLCEDE